MTPKLFICGVLLLLLPYTHACPQEIAQVCQKCQLWLEGLQLDCSYANFTEVTSILKSLSSPVQLLEIHSTNLGGVIKRDDFEGIFIKQLDISGNKLRQIEKGAFLSMASSLQVLRAANNTLSMFPDLEGLRQLIALDLSGNQLSAIPDAAFTDTLALRQLRLERNNICQLSPGALEETKSFLELLDLSDNCLSFVPAQNLRGAQRLTYLDMSNNQISDIPSMQFMNMPMLKEARLSNNRIRSMTPLSFMNVRSLQQLDLSNNKLTNIIINQFQGFERIINIDLSNNELSKIQPSAFKDLLSLEQLDLSMNHIDAVQTLSFSNCPRLQTLSLQNNQIDQVYRNSFESLNRLNTLNLANNSLTEAGSGMFDGMPNLKQLALRNNKITNIADDAFAQLNQLTTLDLGENDLKSIPKSAFSSMDKLFWLDICCNEIRTIEEDTFKRKIANILLQSNPWQCDEKLDPFINYLVVNNVRTFLPNQNDVVCSGPPDMAGVRLKDVMITKANDTFYKTLESLKNLPGLNAFGGGGLLGGSDLAPGGFDDALKGFADPLTRMMTGGQSNAGDLSDLVSSIPNFVGQLPSYPQIDLSNIPPEIINTVLSGGEIPGVPKSITDNLVKQYMQKMAATALAANRGLPAPADGVTELPPLTSLPPEFVNGVLQGNSLPGLDEEQTMAIKEHYLNQLKPQQPPDGQVAPPTLVTAGDGSSIDLSPAELIRFLPKNFDLSQLPPPVLQDLAAGKTPRLSDLPQSLIDALTNNADLAAYIKEKEMQKAKYPQKPESLNPDDILARLPPTAPPRFAQTRTPYDISDLDRQTDLKGEVEEENSMTPVYVGAALGVVAAATLGTLAYFCWKRHNGSLPGTDDFDRAKFFGISPKSSYESNTLPFQNNNNSGTGSNGSGSGYGSGSGGSGQPSFMIPPNHTQSSFLDLYGGNQGSNGWIYNPADVPGHGRTGL